MTGPLIKHFYNGSIEIYLNMFSAVMSRLKVDTERGLMEIPLSMSRGYRNSLNKQQNTNTLPFATYVDGNFQIDKSATSNKNNRMVTETARAANRIPIIVPLEYNVRTKKYGEMLQIIEQIYSVFYPSLDGIIKDNVSLNQDQTVKIQLVDHNVTDNWEGDGTEPLSYDCTFNFNLYGSLYGYNYWVKGDGSEEDPTLIKEVIIERGLSMSVMWPDLEWWFTVDKDGTRYPPADERGDI